MIFNSSQYPANNRHAIASVQFSENARRDLFQIQILNFKLAEEI